MTARKDLEDAIAWATNNAEAADAAGDVAMAARYRTLANSSEAQLAALPPDPSWTLRVTIADRVLVSEHPSRSAAVLAASNFLSTGARMVEITP